jgi:hypothetical protein
MPRLSELKAGMSDDIEAAIAKAIHNAPDWLRQHLASKDLSARLRAEETLAAKVAAAIKSI